MLDAPVDISAQPEPYPHKIVLPEVLALQAYGMLRFAQVERIADSTLMHLHRAQLMDTIAQQILAIRLRMRTNVLPMLLLPLMPMVLQITAIILRVWHLPVISILVLQ